MENCTRGNGLMPHFYKPKLRPGDIIACSGSCLQSDFINVVTFGIPRVHASHLMICAEVANALLLFESTTGCSIPCAINGQCINGTQAHEIGPRIAEYRGKVWHYPLVKPLRAEERRRLSKYLINTIALPYDTIGGLRSGGKIWNAINRRLHPESLSALFCSEWVASALTRIERFDTISASGWSPNGLIRELRNRGIVRECMRMK